MSQKNNTSRTMMVRGAKLMRLMMVQRFIINQILCFKQSLINNRASLLQSYSNFYMKALKHALKNEAELQEYTR